MKLVYVYYTNPCGDGCCDPYPPSIEVIDVILDKDLEQAKNKYFGNKYRFIDFILPEEDEELSEVDIFEKSKQELLDRIKKLENKLNSIYEFQEASARMDKILKNVKQRF